MAYKICSGDGMCAPLHKILHKETPSNKVAQVVLGAITPLTGATFAILGATSCLPLTATAWGIGVSVVSLVAFGVFRRCSSTKAERNRETDAREILRQRQVLVDQQTKRLDRESERLDQQAERLGRQAERLDRQEKLGKRLEEKNARLRKNLL